ncbi:hypothetical protein [Kitasatospora sp. NPDC001175]
MTALEDWRANLLQTIVEHEASDAAARRKAQAEHREATTAAKATSAETSE